MHSVREVNTYFRTGVDQLGNRPLKTWAVFLSAALMIGMGGFLIYRLGLSVYYLVYSLVDGYFALDHLPDTLFSMFNAILFALFGFWAVSIIHDSEENFLELKPLILVIGLGVIISLGLTSLPSEYDYDESSLLPSIYSLSWALTNLGLLSFVLYRLQTESKWLKFLVLFLLISSVISLILCSVDNPNGGWLYIRENIEYLLSALMSIWAICMLFKTPAWVRLSVGVLMFVVLIFYTLFIFPSGLLLNFRFDNITILFSHILITLHTVPTYVFMLLCLYRPGILSWRPGTSLFQ